MRQINGRKHFFGSHPRPLNNGGNYSRWIAAFENAAKKLPPGVEIINATPGSALRCFPMMTLAEALSAEGRGT